MVRVVYETIEDCRGCVHNRTNICMKLGRYLRDICFELDCPLPYLEEVERFTRYVTKDKKLECHGNCKNWERWHYNKSLNTDVGVCRASCLACDVMLADEDACEEFDEI